LGRVGSAHERVQTERRRQRRLAVPFRDPKQADRVDAAALLVAAPELAQEVTLEALEGEGDAGTLTRLVAEEMGEEALELAEAGCAHMLQQRLRGPAGHS